MPRRNRAPWCAGCWTCTSAGTNWCSCSTGRRMRNSNSGLRSCTSSGRNAPYPRICPRGAVHGYYLSRDPVRLLVVVKQAGGAADAMNAGVNAAQYPVIGLVDREADFIPELLLRLIRPMLGDWERVVAVCGVAPPPPAPGLAGCIGAIEASRLWLARCAAFSTWNRLLPVPGACMLVKRDAICSVGGFRAGPLELCLGPPQRFPGQGPGAEGCVSRRPCQFPPRRGHLGRPAPPVRSDQRQLASALGRSGADRRQGILRPVLCPRIMAPAGNRPPTSWLPPGGSRD